MEAIVAEGVACAKAGAAIIHTHAYANGSSQTFDWQVYARIIEGIRKVVDVPVYPSYPAIPDHGPGLDAATRFAHLDALAERGLLDFAVIDPGSVNFTTAVTKSGAKPAFTYLNPEAHVRHALDFAKRQDLHPAFAIYEPGFTRAGDRRPRRRRAAFDRRDGGQGRPCARRPRGCPAWNADRQCWLGG